MKAYGKPRATCANRYRKGTSRPCPCCVPLGCHIKLKKWKKAERQSSKKETLE
jgi:hypothetical protein